MLLPDKQKNPQPYDTLALAEKAKMNKKDQTSRPSLKNVQEAREWSEELKL